MELYLCMYFNKSNCGYFTRIKVLLCCASFATGTAKKSMDVRKYCTTNNLSKNIITKKKSGIDHALILYKCYA